MDEMETIATQPSAAAVDEGRHRLMSAMPAAEPKPRRRRGRLALAAVAATAACSVMVAAAVVFSGATTSTASAGGTASSARADLSGNEVLLAAAATAEKAPESTGRYWYHAYEWTEMKPGATKPPTSPTKNTYLDQFWNDRNGRLWHAKNGQKPKHLPAKTGFYTLYHDYTFKELQKLPADPDALRDLTKKNYEKERAKDGSTTRFVSLDSIIAGALVDFLYEVPVPPKVRAAAFRALADLPEVKSAGTIDGGNAVRYSVGDDKVTVVVDPKTSLLRSVHRVGKIRQSHYMKIVAATWTDQLRATPATSGPAEEPAVSGD